jgi:hypothetical protein
VGEIAAKTVVSTALHDGKEFHGRRAARKAAGIFSGRRRLRDVFRHQSHLDAGMTKAAALDYAKRNIRVNAVGPGPVETPLLVKGTGGDPNSYAAFVPMGRIGQPDEIADAVLWLLSEDARYVTGHTLPVDGGVCAQ